MTSKIIKKMLNEFDIDTLDVYERLQYNEYLTSLPKLPALLKLVYSSHELSEELQELREFIQEYELTIKT
jgi:hypothetical protein